MSAIEKWEGPISRSMLWAGIAGFLVSVPLWAFGVLSDWMMLGVTLVLSFAALWYAAFIAMQEERHAREMKAVLVEIQAVLNQVKEQSFGSPPVE